MEEVRGLRADIVNLILFGRGGRQRFTQETPILPEVWQEFAATPTRRHDLLITPLKSTSSVRLLRELTTRLPRDVWQHAGLAPLQSFVAANLTFTELVVHILPLTKWAVDARARFASRPGTLPFDPAQAFDQVFASACGRPYRGKKVLSGDLFDIARIVTLIAAINVSEDASIPEIKTVEDLGSIGGRISARIGALLVGLYMMEGLEGLIWRVAANRTLALADEYARATVKADAAYRLFDVKCETITWAVVDSGIDGKHRGFLCDPLDEESGSRVVRTYDFSILRQLLDPAFDPELGGDPKRNPAFKTARRRSGLDAATVERHVGNIYQSYRTEILDWSSIEPLLAVVRPETPTDGHGTHVAGIIGGDFREKADRTKVVMRGLCPDIRLMDLRIISGTLEDTEFAVIGALQLVRYLNSHNQYIVVHGVNLSLSIPHVVESYACGRTPVCDESERLVGAGVTVVAAAGNNGYHRYLTQKGPFAGYATVSITDPGNAEAVITVGATHRRDPHSYGVSYFSSRGPTGDGRLKPDLVAPGERIESLLPRDETGTLDGTSQAAPHVSAAAAMLMARYPEINRQPQRIKQILCESATDLGRERAFQGHGLLDALRALQSF